MCPVVCCVIVLSWVQTFYWKPFRLNLLHNHQLNLQQQRIYVFVSVEAMISRFLLYMQQQLWMQQEKNVWFWGYFSSLQSINDLLFTTCFWFFCWKLFFLKRLTVCPAPWCSFLRCHFYFLSSRLCNLSFNEVREATVHFHVYLSWIFCEFLDELSPMHSEEFFFPWWLSPSVALHLSSLLGDKVSVSVEPQKLIFVELCFS